MALGPPERPNHLFREGGPIDLAGSVWLVCASALFGLAFLTGPGSAPRRSWLVASTELLVSGIDERFQSHEFRSEGVPTPALPGVRN